jgi:multicomponent Na+:H+ antiporter subunit G
VTLLGWMLSGLGAATLLVAAVGVVRLPDALARQHAATKAVTLALLVFILGAGIAIADSGWTWRLLALAAILLLTLPLASHALARAGMQEREEE